MNFLDHIHQEHKYVNTYVDDHRESHLTSLFSTTLCTSTSLIRLIRRISEQHSYN